MGRPAGEQKKMSEEEVKEAGRLRMVLRRGFQDAKKQAKTPEGLEAMEKSSLRILALPPAAQRKFALKFEECSKSMDLAITTWEQDEEEKISRKDHVQVKPMIHSQIVRRSRQTTTTPMFMYMYMYMDMHMHMHMYMYT